MVGSVRLTAHVHITPRVSMCGAVCLLSLYAFVVWTGTALPLCVVVITVDK